MNAPEPGFYYHCKHDPNGPVNNYAYEVLATGTHTETHEKFAIYRSLYQTDTQGGTNYWLRPLAMFMENVEKDRQTFPRFKKIEDPSIISELANIRDRMYNQK